MNVSILQATDNIDRVVASCGRGDYMPSSLVGIDVSNDNEYREVMKPVKGDTLDEKTENLIRKFIKRGHFGPMEQNSITFAIEGMSRACMAQLTRHRHASFDVQSMRYVDFSGSNFKMPESIESGEAQSRKEGVVEIDEIAKDIFNNSVELSLSWYKELVEMGVPKEDARSVLPIATKINMTMTVNLRTLLHIANLRAKADAQSEIRELTNMILEEAEKVAPITMGVWDESTPMQISP